MIKKVNNFSLNVNDTYKARPRKWIINLILVAVFIFLIINSWKGLGIDIKDRDVSSLFRAMINGFLHPNIDFLFGRNNFKGAFGVPYLILQTVSIAFIGTIVSAILAIPFGFLTAKNVVGKYSKIGEVFLIIIRTFPEILLALILVRVTGTGALTGTLAIGIHSVGMIGKLYAEAIENIDHGPIEALEACGANVPIKIGKAIMPQVLPDFVSTILYRFDINVRTATVLGVVSAGGIGAPLSFAIAGWHWSDLSAILIAVIVMVIAVDLISGFLRKKLL